MILQRRAIPNIKETFDLDAAVADLHARANKAFNSSLYEKRQVVTYPLAEVLKKLELEPFTTRSVERYKNFQMYKPSRGFFIFATITALLIWSAYVSASNNSEWRFWVGCVVACVAALFSFGRTVYEYIRWDRKWEESTPGHVALSEMPLHVLETAVRVKEALPTAYVFVDKLRMAERTYDPDPFLGVELGHEKYYLEVWDEPRYNEKRKPLV